MLYFRRKSDGFFPVYQAEVDRVGSNAYDEVTDVSGTFDPSTERLGNWSVPEQADGQWQAFREVVALSQHEIDARDYEAWEDLRSQRNSLLAQTDFIMLSDAPFTAEQKTAYATYRQELRDITEGVTDPSSVVFPAKPA